MREWSWWTWAAEGRGPGYLDVTRTAIFALWTTLPAVAVTRMLYAPGGVSLGSACVVLLLDLLPQPDATSAMASSSIMAAVALHCLRRSGTNTTMQSANVPARRGARCDPEKGDASLLVFVVEGLTAVMVRLAVAVPLSESELGPTEQLKALDEVAQVSASVLVKLFTGAMLTPEIAVAPETTAICADCGDRVKSSPGWAPTVMVEAALVEGR